MRNPRPPRSTAPVPIRERSGVPARIHHGAQYPDQWTGRGMPVWPIAETEASGMARRKSGSHRTQHWRRQSRANSSLKPNSLLAGKIQGIFFVWAFGCSCWPAI